MTIITLRHSKALLHIEFYMDFASAVVMSWQLANILLLAVGKLIRARKQRLLAISVKLTKVVNKFA